MIVLRSEEWNVECVDELYIIDKMNFFDELKCQKKKLHNGMSILSSVEKYWYFRLFWGVLFWFGWMLPAIDKINTPSLIVWGFIYCNHSFQDHYHYWFFNSCLMTLITSNSQSLMKITIFNFAKKTYKCKLEDGSRAILIPTNLTIN